MTTAAERLDFMKAAPLAIAAYMQFSQAVKQSSIEHALLNLIDIRVSQLNGCAFCLDMHVQQATIANERPLRLHPVAIWRESSLFSPRERAALAWAEVLTQIPPHGVGDEAYAAVRADFSEQEVADLTFAVMSINGWNRVNIAFASQPGSRDAMFGLNRANLS